MCILSSYIYRNLDRKRKVNRDQRTDRTNGWKKEGQMEVRWLLTNRKHGGKTKSVSVLKAALKNEGMGKNRKTTVNERRKNPNHYDRK